MTSRLPAFARDPATADYHDRHSADHDEWYEGQVRFADSDRTGWDAEVQRVVDLVRGLPPRRMVHVACGTGFLTEHLRGFTVGLEGEVRAALTRKMGRKRPSAASRTVTLGRTFSLSLLCQFPVAVRVHSLGALDSPRCQSSSGPAQRQ